MAQDVSTLLRQERGALADLLETLNADDTLPTIIEGWRLPKGNRASTFDHACCHRACDGGAAERTVVGVF